MNSKEKALVAGLLDTLASADDPPAARRQLIQTLANFTNCVSGEVHNLGAWLATGRYHADLYVEQPDWEIGIKSLAYYIPKDGTLWTSSRTVYHHAAAYGHEQWYEREVYQECFSKYQMHDTLTMPMKDPRGRLHWGIGLSHPRRRGLEKKRLLGLF